MTPTRSEPPEGLDDLVVSKDANATAPEEVVDGIGLCLSGGGFRAMLFHIGSLRRRYWISASPRFVGIDSQVPPADPSRRVRMSAKLLLLKSLGLPLKGLSNDASTAGLGAGN